ncbi:hypothetical protein N665_0211s0028 [Sinapis alba]|nr:hypothetical protein N665_0211s0028 [Sinapis alba]
MKKKKPKKPPSASPPSVAASPAPCSPASLAVVEIQSPTDPALALEPQIDNLPDEITHHAKGLVDLGAGDLGPEEPKTVIVQSTTDPSSAGCSDSRALTASCSETPVLDKAIFHSSTKQTTSVGPAPLALADAGIALPSSLQAIPSPVSTSAGVSIAAAQEPSSNEANQVPVCQKQPLIDPIPRELGKAVVSRDIPENQYKKSSDNAVDQTVSWCDRAKGSGKPLKKSNEAFVLPSGESCIKIPNSVIEKNRKAWDPFVMGQFYSDPPSQGTLHNIVNGIWSRNYRDIVVSKMEGSSFLFRIPNVATRNRVISQGLCQIEGQTMFVDKWEPGVVPVKPELTSAPIWLELRNVPFQFFNEYGLERIASLVGHPKRLHPMTANKTNLEVAKVFTIIDPRKPLPEAVNVQFESGEISRVLVSIPWMPPVCEFCKEIGHTTKRCMKAPKACKQCASPDHAIANCPSKPNIHASGKKTRRGRSKDKQQWAPINPSSLALAEANVVSAAVSAAARTFTAQPETSLGEMHSRTEIVLHSKLGTLKDKARGETSDTPEYLRSPPRKVTSGYSTPLSNVQSDSSDTESSESELEEGEFGNLELDFQVVGKKKAFSGIKGSRGNGPKLN